jgi:hypothetical protein
MYRNDADHVPTPDDILAIARMLLVYCKQYTRPISNLGLKRAKRLLSLAARERKGGVHWTFDVHWRTKLKAAGIDPDTLEVRDKTLWARASKQLIETGTWDWFPDQEPAWGPQSAFQARAVKLRETRLTRRAAHQAKLERLEAKEKLEEPQQINQVQEMLRRKFGG